MSRKENYLFDIFLLLLAISLQFFTATGKKDVKEQCKTCNDIVDAFHKGMEKTIKANFGGGNTAWEERKLGSYAKSETRLVEIIEGLCESSASLCHSMVEEHEELLEQWWFQLQSKEKDLKSWLCIHNIKVCCGNGTYGPDCKECPSSKDDPCHGHGDCEGAGTRGGTGKCTCHPGYEGDECDECAEDYFEGKDENKKIQCTPCHESCSKGCSGSTPKDCTECKTGWEKSDDKGCEDVNECKDVDKCSGGEYCVNTPGSHNCEACHESCEGNCTSAGAKGCLTCKTGYNMTEEEGCKDYDECAADTSSSLCDKGTYCKNTPGTYECAACHESCDTCIGDGPTSCTKCSDGYKRDEDKCKDIDECAAEKSPCEHENEVCVNSEGSFTCDCRDGYQRKGDGCVKDSESDEDEDEGDNDSGDDGSHDDSGDVSGDDDSGEGEGSHEDKSKNISEDNDEPKHDEL